MRIASIITSLFTTTIALVLFITNFNALSYLNILWIFFILISVNVISTLIVVIYAYKGIKSLPLAIIAMIFNFVLGGLFFLLYKPDEEIKDKENE